MNFFAIAILLLFGYILQCFLTTIQIKDFTKAYNDLKKQGRVAIGKVSGVFRAGAIAMFAIDEEGIILDGSYMMGVTILAKFKPFNILDSKNIADIKEEDIIHLTKPLRRAILDSSNNYNIFVAGAEIPENLSVLQKVNNKFQKNNDKK